MNRTELARREIAELIAVGLLSQPNAAGLTAIQAHEIGRRVADALRPSSAAILEEPALDPRRLRQAMRRTGIVDALPGAVAYAEDIAREYAHASSEGQSAGKE